jgi:hypothetical protein
MSDFKGESSKRFIKDNNISDDEVKMAEECSEIGRELMTVVLPLIDQAIGKELGDAVGVGMAGILIEAYKAGARRQKADTHFITKVTADWDRRSGKTVLQ